MKVGDKVYCIKNYMSGVDKKVNTKGKIYTIIEYDNYNIHVDTNFKDGTGCDINHFIVGSKTPGYCFDRYFIDLKEYRKLKLKKIYEISDR